MENNILLQTDSYKISHRKLYPAGMTYSYAYFESRGGEFDTIPFFGLKYYLDTYLCKPFTKENIEEYQDLCKHHLGFDDSEIWYSLLDKHGGYLPIKVRAVPEGTKVPPKNVLFTVENTDPAFAFLTGYLETLFVKMWYPITVAAQSYYIRSILEEYNRKSGDYAASVNYQCHDFGYRGVSSEETAALGSAAHLQYFFGTDTIAGIRLLNKHYGYVKGESVPATEHSVATAFGENEEEYLNHVLTTYPTGIVSIVADSYNQFAFIKNVIGKAKNRILQRNGKLVIRLDSGDPVESVMKALTVLSTVFEVKQNSKGYKVLPSQIGILQGDGIDRFSIRTICDTMTSYGWSTDNIVFGSGGGLLQKLNRDTCRFAYKLSYAEINGKYVNISKKPFGDPDKWSKAGRLKLVKSGDTYTTISSVNNPAFDDAKDILETVYNNA